MTDPTCRDCGKTLVWATPYVKGKPPVNADGSAHNCSGTQSGHISASPQTPRKEITIEEILSDVVLVEATMSPKAKDSPANIEGRWKYIISRKMSR
jgi:hypothetical protein